MRSIKTGLFNEMSQKVGIKDDDDKRPNYHEQNVKGDCQRKRSKEIIRLVGIMCMLSGLQYFASPRMHRAAVSVG